MVHFLVLADMRYKEIRERSDLYSDSESESIHADRINFDPMQIGFWSKVRLLVSLAAVQLQYPQLQYPLASRSNRWIIAISHRHQSAAGVSASAVSIGTITIACRPLPTTEPYLSRHVSGQPLKQCSKLSGMKQEIVSCGLQTRRAQSPQTAAVSYTAEYQVWLYLAQLHIPLSESPTVWWRQLASTRKCLLLDDASSVMPTVAIWLQL